MDKKNMPTLPQIPLPSLSQLKTAVAYAPKPLRPYAERLLRILHPLHDIEDNSSSSNDGNRNYANATEAGDDSDSGSLDMSVSSLHSLSPGLESERDDSRVSRARANANGNDDIRDRGQDRGQADPLASIPRALLPGHRNHQVKSQNRQQESRSRQSSSQNQSPFAPTPFSSTRVSQAQNGSSHLPFPSISSSSSSSDSQSGGKVELSEWEKASVPDKLTEALADNYFNMYPTYEDSRVGGAAEEEDLDDGSVPRPLTEAEKNRKDQLMFKWRMRADRNIEKRRRYQDHEIESYNGGKGVGFSEEFGKGYESVLEARELRRNDMFMPTLGLMLESQDDGSSNSSSERQYPSSEESKQSISGLKRREG